MGKIRLLTPGTLILALTLLFPIGCGDDGSTGPDNGNGTPGNPVAEAFEAVSDAADAIFTGNEELFASLLYFGPEVRTTLTMTPYGSDAVQQSCIPTTKQGKVFMWDTLSNRYSGVDSSMAPPDGAIYILYRVDESGILQVPLVETGYIEAQCLDRESPTSDSLMVKLVNTGGSIDREVTHIGFSGLFYDPAYYIKRSKGTLKNGGVEFKIEVWGEGELGGQTPYIKENFQIDLFESLNKPELEGVTVNIGLWDLTLDSRGMPIPGFYSFGAGVYKSGTFNCGVLLGVNDMGTISNIDGGEKAPLEFEDLVGGADGVLACFSGKYNDFDLLTVEASDVDGGCATGVIDVPIPLDDSALADIKMGYIKLLRLLNTVMTPMWVSGVEMVMSP